MTVVYIEAGRKMKNKRIHFGGSGGSDDDFVDIPVITQIVWRDAKTNAQEFHWLILNMDAPRSERKTVNKTVHSSIGNAEIEQEVIWEFPYRDKKTNQNQHYVVRMPKDENLDARITHVARYFNYNTKEVWIDLRRTDKVNYKDPKTNSQDYTFILNHLPPAEEQRIAEPADEVLNGGG